jgi:hypothetical protein
MSELAKVFRCDGCSRVVAELHNDILVKVSEALGLDSLEIDEFRDTLLGNELAPASA